jgi:hypothetical protein
MGIGVLTRKSTEWTHLYHCDQANMDLKVLVPEVDSGPGRHIGNSRIRELTERLLGHGSSSSSRYRREWSGYQWYGRGSRDTSPLLP